MENKKNALTAEFLYELYSTAIRYEHICNILVQHMKKEYLPDRCFQLVQEAFINHYNNYKCGPSYAVLSQTFNNNPEVIELINTFKEHEGFQNTEIITDMFESYIKGVRLQNVYIEVGKLYNENKQEKAQEKLKDYADWVSGFTLKSTSFINVIDTFKERFDENKQKELEQSNSSLLFVSRFYISELDALNNGRSLRGQLTCFLASTGVGKSHCAKHIGTQAAIADGLNVLHFQLEGSEEEALNAYSGSLIGKNAYFFERGKISDIEMKRFIKQLQQYQGNITVRCFPRFNTRVSTLDIKNGIAEFRKINNINPDIVIVDSMDLLTDSSRKIWGAEHERSKRIAVANDLKDIAADENLWMVTTYQATIESKAWLDDEKNVLTEYNCSEAKGLARPCTHLISLNQSKNERKEDTMRIHVAKARFFKKGKTFKIATDYNNEVFYDARRTLELNR